MLLFHVFSFYLTEVMSSPEPGLLAGYRPPLSLWRLVEQHVAVHELGEIKNMLGEDIIEETLELHMEIEALLDIWRDCREQSEHKVCHLFCL